MESDLHTPGSENKSNERMSYLFLNDDIVTELFKRFHYNELHEVSLIDERLFNLALNVMKNRVKLIDDIICKIEEITNERKFETSDEKTSRTKMIEQLKNIPKEMYGGKFNKDTMPGADLYTELSPQFIHAVIKNLSRNEQGELESSMFKKNVDLWGKEFYKAFFRVNEIYMEFSDLVNSHDIAIERINNYSKTLKKLKYEALKDILTKLLVKLMKINEKTAKIVNRKGGIDKIRSNVQLGRIINGGLTSVGFRSFRVVTKFPWYFSELYPIRLVLLENWGTE